MHTNQLRNYIENEELDYVMLMSFLSGYSNPRDKISRLLHSGELIRIKKGIYIFGPDMARKPYSVETLANQIYGPSAISLEYALAWHRLIPERVTTVTSVTPSRNKLFKTPVGLFSYTHQHPDAFPEGIALVTLDPTHNVLMATREKALADLLTLSRACPIFNTTAQVREYLEESLRIDNVDLYKLNPTRLRRLEKTQHNRNISLLRELIETHKEKPHA
jgi:predicted transcriptional regulator of viral defense system